MILPPFDVEEATDAEIIRYYVQVEGDSLEEARAMVELLRNPEEAEGLD